MPKRLNATTVDLDRLAHAIVLVLTDAGQLRGTEAHYRKRLDDPDYLRLVLGTYRVTSAYNQRTSGKRSRKSA